MWFLTAWAVVALHAAYLVFQTLGALLILRHRHWLWAHLAAVTWGVLIVVVQGACPLTALEKHLVERGGDTPYSGSYLDHYLFGRVLPDGSQTLVYGLHLLVILGCYAYVRHVRARAASPSGVPGRGHPYDRLPTGPA